jgi:hypothetical protein
MRAITALVALLAISSVSATAATYFVAPDGSGDYPTIGAAIQACVDGDVIELGNGTFTGPGNRDIAVPSNLGITVRSQGGDPTQCIIDLQGTASEHHYGFSFNAIGPGSLPQCTLEKLTILNGHSLGGGAIGVSQMAQPTLDGCLLINNTGEMAGGAIEGDGGVDLFNCTLVGNSCGAAGGSAIYLEDWGGLEVSNTVIAFGTGGPAVVYYSGPPLSFSCCDIYGNDGGDWVGAIAGFFGSDGNISLDPLFCDRPNGDYRLEEDSPCAPFSPQNPTCDLVGALSIGCPSSPVERTSWGRIRAMFGR